MHIGVHVHHRAGVDPHRGTTTLAFLPELGDAGEIEVRLVGDDTGTARNGHIAHGRPHNDTRRLGGGELLLVAWVAEKTQVGRGG